MFAPTCADWPRFICLQLAVFQRLVLPPTHAVLQPVPSCSSSPFLPWKNLPSEIFLRVSIESSQTIVHCLRQRAEIIQLQVKSSLLLHVPTVQCIKQALWWWKVLPAWKRHISNCCLREWVASSARDSQAGSKHYLCPLVGEKIDLLSSGCFTQMKLLGTMLPAWFLLALLAQPLNVPTPSWVDEE